MNIGVKLKELRLKAGLTQEELADRCELTKGYISQLENDLTSPSIATLETILLALGSNIKSFFGGIKEEEKVVFTNADYFEKLAEDHRIIWLVTNSQKNEMEPIILELNPGAKMDEDMPHEGEEFGYILNGTVMLNIGGKSYELKKGDTFYYTADKIHYIENVGKTNAQIIWVSSPPNF
ncbi:MAG TPA: XRE family transcriptional regulator [Clostridia bacterium]